MKLDHCLIVFDDQMLRAKLRPVWKNLTQLRESTCNEGPLAQVVAGERMRPHHCPVDIVGHMIEKGSSVAVL
jgi:hypothetical protein